MSDESMVVISPMEFHARREVRAAAHRRGMRSGSARQAEIAAGMAIRAGADFRDACNAGVAILDAILTGVAQTPHTDSGTPPSHASQEPRLFAWNRLSQDGEIL